MALGKMTAEETIMMGHFESSRQATKPDQQNSESWLTGWPEAFCVLVIVALVVASINGWLAP